MLTRHYWPDDRCRDFGLSWIQNTLGTILYDVPLPDDLAEIVDQRDKARRCLGGIPPDASRAAKAALVWLQASRERRLKVVRAVLQACEEFLNNDDELEAWCGVWARRAGADADAMRQHMTCAADEAMAELGIEVTS